MNEQARAAVLGWQQTVNATWAKQQAGEQPSVTRGLSPAEIAAARSVFGDTLDTSKIQLTEGGPLGIGGYARTIPGLVTFPAGTLSNPPAGFNRWLIHELTHAWQYQHGASVPDLLPDAIVGHYDYGGQQGLRDAWAQGKNFGQFNHEQQADILADYYEHLGGDTSAYDPYVRAVRIGATDVLREPSPPPGPAI